MVEELLKLFVDKVDHQLLQGVELKDLESSNVQNTNEVYFLHGGVNQSVVTHVNKVAEETTKDILDDGVDSGCYNSDVLGLGHPFSADLREDRFQ